MEVNGADVSNAPLMSSDRLRKVDILREKNTGSYLPLPQLVAVGDQSSGKSSLLESVTGIPFPRGQTLCTRYATQITSRRDEHSRIDISIIPSPLASPADKERLEAYHKTLDSTAGLVTEFPGILEEARTLMGIRSSKSPKGSKTFSRAVLKIEKCGPKEDYLTVIDVPGIFRNTDEMTTEADRTLINKMVRGYISDPRTIILAVLPSNVDIATQEILSLAEEYDPTGERTVGVLTKPDLLKGPGAKAAVCDLVEGRRKALKLGYYIVRSRDSDEEASDMDKHEDMFQEDPWCRLPPHRLGIAALRETLQDLLGQITDRVFPKLRTETRQMLETAQQDLEALGGPRQTEREQQRYLVNIAGKFQGLVRAALDADYSAAEEFADVNLRLITTVVNITEGFNTDFATSSHLYIFKKKQKTPKPKHTSGDFWNRPPSPTGPPADYFEESLNSGGKPTDDDSDEYHVDNSDLEEFPDLARILCVRPETENPSKGIMAWIERIHRRSRGLELGTFGPRLLSSAFREQSRKWEPMTQRYLSTVVLAVHRFVVGALEIVCVDARVREALTSTIMGDLLGRYTEGLNQAKFLVEVERDKHPYTLNHYFNSNLQESRGSRLRKNLRHEAYQEHGKHSSGSLVVKLDDIPSAVENKSNEQQSVEDIHDILEAYYKVARKRFVDNVFNQAVSHCLLFGPNSPLAVFSEQWVLRLSTEELTAIAGESRLTSQRREALEKTIQNMEEAIEVLR